MGITLTSSAAEHVASYLEKRGHGIGIRLAVKTTGCSGLMYVIEPVDKPTSEDLQFNCKGVEVYVDPKSMTYVKGSRMDYVKQGLNEGFEFTNPNVQGECGCGESFTAG
jgi:iron-sulfur cluster assembly protein